MGYSSFICYQENTAPLTENKLVVANVRGKGQYRDWGRQAQNIVYKTGYGNVLYNTQNIANIL